LSSDKCGLPGWRLNLGLINLYQKIFCVMKLLQSLWTLRQEHTPQQACEGEVLRRIFVPKMDEVVEKVKILHN